MKEFKINADHIGVASGKLLKVKDLCIGVGCILLSAGLYADILGTKWAPADKVKELMKNEVNKE